MSGKPTCVESGFLNQLKTLPVRLKPQGAGRERCG